MLKRTRAIVAATVSLIIIAILISVAVFANREPFGTPLLYLIVEGNFTVNADSYKAYNFTTPTDISQCQVSGSFSVSGSNSSKIRVFIWDNAAFTSWQNGHVSQSPLGRAISFYDSGLSTNGTIDASLYPGGTYWLIYDNNSTEPQNVISQADFWYLLK